MIKNDVYKHNHQFTNAKMLKYLAFLCCGITGVEELTQYWQHPFPQQSVVAARCTEREIQLWL